MIDPTKVGFRYRVEVLNRHTGEVVNSETVHNLMPDVGIHHALDVLLNGASQVTQWYLLPFGNNYTPQPTDTSATFPALAGEITAYAGATRPAIVTGAAAGGAVTNDANRVELDFPATTTVQGAAIISTPTKGAAAGILLSAVKFASPKVVDSDSILRVLVGIEFASLS